MKKITIICIASLIAFNVNAQFSFWHIGLIGGPSSTWLLNSDVSNIPIEMNYKSSVGGCFGLSLTHNFVEKTALKIEFIYSMHNQSYNGDFNGTDVPLGYGNGDSYVAETKLTYLDIPVLLHFGKANSPYIELGPQIGFLLGAKEDYTYTSTSGLINTLHPNESNVNYKSDFNNMNICGVLGFGYNASLSSLISLDLGIRLGYSLMDVTKSFPQTDWIPAAGGTIVPHSLSSTYAHFDSFNLIQIGRAHV